MYIAISIQCAAHTVCTLRVLGVAAAAERAARAMDTGTGKRGSRRAKRRGTARLSIFSAIESYGKKRDN